LFVSDTHPSEFISKPGFQLPDYQITRLKMGTPLPVSSQDLKELRDSSQAIPASKLAFLIRDHPR